MLSNSLQPHEPQHARPPCPSPTPGVYPNPCPSSRWCHQTVSSSVVPFSSCPQSFPASGSFPMSQLFSSGSQSVEASASVPPMNTQDWSPLGWTGWISLQSKGITSGIFKDLCLKLNIFFFTKSSVKKMYKGKRTRNNSGFSSGDIFLTPIWFLKCLFLVNKETVFSFMYSSEQHEISLFCVILSQ